MKKERSDALLTDLYQLTMANGYLKCGMANKIAVFDLFFRGNEEISYAVAAGLEQAIEFLTSVCFQIDDIEYLRDLKIFDEEFLKTLQNFKFTGDVYAVPEGTVVFPNEPILTIVAPLFEAQYIETLLLNIINHQTLIATKASKITNNANGGVLEFGLRRAQGGDAGIYGARAAMIGGCVATSNVLAGKMFGVKVSGTHSHSWVMSFKDELSAFRAYAEIYPNNCLLLVDTYDTVNSGIPNAIIVFKELIQKGYKPVGIRLDSGDLAYLSRYARKILDNEGLKDVKIFASNDIDENVLISLKAQNAAIDVWGIGTKLITSYSMPALGGVYKLSAIGESKDALLPKIKISNTFEKITNPGLKKIVRIYSKETNLAEADLIMLYDETIDTSKPLTIFHPEQTWKKTTFTNYYVKEINVKVMENGKVIYKLPSIKEIMENAKISLLDFENEYKRVDNPHIYKVDLSQKLFDLKNDLLHKNI